MSNSQNIADFFNTFTQRVQAVNERLPEIIGTEVVNSTVDNFRDESYFGKKWKPRKDRKNTRKLLVKTGTLQRSTRNVRSQPGLVVVGTDVPYAAVHNNGGTINRAARSETFVRNRNIRAAKKGLFRKGTTQGQGFTFKAYGVLWEEESIERGVQLTQENISRKLSKGIKQANRVIISLYEDVNVDILLNVQNGKFNASKSLQEIEFRMPSRTIYYKKSKTT